MFKGINSYANARGVGAEVQPPVDGVDALVRIRKVMRDLEVDVVSDRRPGWMRLRTLLDITRANGVLLQGLCKRAGVVPAHVHAMYAERDLRKLVLP